jgi:hypothetical protein
VPVTRFDQAQTGLTALDARLARPRYRLVAHSAHAEATMIAGQRQHFPPLGATSLLCSVRVSRAAFPELSSHQGNLMHRYPQARAELEARLPGWRGAAAAIGGLGTGLDDAGYVGGVLWYGLAHRGGQGNPEEQRRIITDRLVRWATRDGGDSARTAAVIRSVLDEHLAGR